MDENTTRIVANLQGLSGEPAALHAHYHCIVLALKEWTSEQAAFEEGKFLEATDEIEVFTHQP